MARVAGLLCVGMFGAAALVAGCAADNTPETWALRDKSKTVALIEGEPSRAYTVIKPISVHLAKGPPQYGGDLYISDAQRALQFEAVKLGADAVIKTKYHDEPINIFKIGPTAWGWVDGSGVAVKYK